MSDNDRVFTGKAFRAGSFTGISSPLELSLRLRTWRVCNMLYLPAKDELRSETETQKAIFKLQQQERESAGDDE